MEILKTENLKKTYGTGEAKVEALRGVNLSVNKGEFLSIRSEERRVGKECRSRWSPYH